MKSLSQLFSKAKAPPPAAEVIPQVFLNENEVVQIDAKTHDDEPRRATVTLPMNGKASFVVPGGASAEAVATRAIAYGEYLCHAEEILTSEDVKKMRQRSVHSNWVGSVRFAVAFDLLKERDVSEVDGMHLPLLDTLTIPIHQIGTELTVLSRVPDGRVMEEALRRELYKRCGPVALKALEQFDQIQEALLPVAKAGGDLTKFALKLQEIFGAPDTEGNLGKAMAELAAGPPKPGSKEGLPMPGSPPLDASLDWQDGIPFLRNIGDDENADWGVMSIKHPPMAATRKTQKLAKKWRRGMVGAFRFPWRALPSSDGYAFALRRRVPAGTILIDCSGSMGLSQSQIETIVESSPHVTVACYASEHTNQTGALVIAAKAGRMMLVRNLRRYLGGGNIVDGPALKWLTEQEGPRVWVSDGMVTGYEESQHHTLNQQCAALCAFGEVASVPSAAHLIEMLRH